MPLKKPQIFTGFSSISSHEHPNSAFFHICEENGRYKAYIYTSCLENPLQVAPIEMSSADLKELNKQLREAMTGVARERNWTSTPGRSTERLVEMGHIAFKKVFGHPDAQSIIQRLQDLSTGAYIGIGSKDFLLPWELIYPTNLDEPLSYECFWGMNYIISRYLRSEADYSQSSRSHRPNVGLLTYNRLSSVREKEIPFFEELERDDKITLSRLRPLNRDKKKDELTGEFKGFWKKPLDAAHFACHAFYDDQSPMLSYIELSNEFCISVTDMENYDITIDSHPLIIMNACETGRLNPLYTTAFEEAFLRLGARTVVATECRVPDAFAADFTRQLYTYLLEGCSVGESLLYARQYFLERYHNPLGLLYSLYGSPVTGLDV